VLCILGTDEYLYKEDIMATKFFIGVPWHGYDYKCSDYEVNVQNNITFSEEISVWVRLS
jgi:hypothetical protein